jgi:hypothetical protein
VFREPVDGRAGGAFDVGFQVGVEVAAGNDDELLRLASPVERFDRQIGRRRLDDDNGNELIRILGQLRVTIPLSVQAERLG